MHNNSCADDTAGCVISSVNPPRALAFPSAPGAGSSHAGVGPGCVVGAAFHIPSGFRSTTGTSAEHLEPLGWAWWHQTGLCRAQSPLVSLLCHCGVTGTNCHWALGFLFCKTQAPSSPPTETFRLERHCEILGRSQSREKYFTFC